MALFIVILRRRLTLFLRIMSEGLEEMSRWCSKVLHPQSLNAVPHLVSVKYLSEVPSECVALEVFVEACYLDVVRLLKRFTFPVKSTKPVYN